MIYKICRICDIEKEITDFYTDRAKVDKHTSECKKCNDSLRMSRPFNRTKGLASPTQVVELSKKFNGACWICKKVPTRKLAVDHCHKQMKFRGLLCIKCNSGLGMFDDDIEILKAAVLYLEDFLEK